MFHHGLSETRHMLAKSIYHIPIRFFKANWLDYNHEIIGRDISG